MSLEQRLLELIELYMEGELSEEGAAELLGLLHRSPKSVGISRDLLATDYHLREMYHDDVYRKSLEESVSEQLTRVATADDFLASTLQRIQELGKRWGDEEKTKRRSPGPIARLVVEPLLAGAARLRQLLPSSE